ncbi:Nucleotidyl transferase [Thiorhodococcus drewsii AZ1]|uniref:Nucleotidyl transferase n=1 Tax=Thiorhodococcus drewsii AZ1 TaxID=765913 RepID=G2E7E2_9GAMM|nr:nucleotidyltransferase family protein [Thiorhodococcus drewsii]EGV27981.1 Nucleotidyl transferase [Thiorhodococcus drewsii AZ1]
MKFERANITTSTSTPIRDVIAVIDHSATQIALVVNDSGALVGTVTDGDIRRSLLRGESLDQPIENIMHRGFRALTEHSTGDEALALMRREKIRQIPVLDSAGRLVQVFFLDELIRPVILPNSVVIMAGGEGKRLRPMTQNCPKPMLRVGDRPLLEIILQQCIDAGFREFYLAVNYLKHQIKDYFGDGARFNVQIRYLEETQPLGTAGALSLLSQRPTKPLLVMNGDVLTRVDFSCLLRFHEEHNPAATLCVREHATQIPYGVVRTDDIHVLGLEEKPVLTHYVNAGIYLLNPELLDLLPENQFYHMPQLLEQAVGQQCRVAAFPIHEYWLDVGLPETLERAHGEWR